MHGRCFLGPVLPVAAVPFHPVGGEHDRRADLLTAETVAPIAGELVVHHKAVPAGDLDAAPFVCHEDIPPEEENPYPQEMHAVAREPLDLAVVNGNGILVRAVPLRIVQEDAVNGLLRLPAALQGKPAR